MMLYVKKSQSRYHYKKGTKKNWIIVIAFTKLLVSTERKLYDTVYTYMAMG